MSDAQPEANTVLPTTDAAAQAPADTLAPPAEAQLYKPKPMDTQSPPPVQQYQQAFVTLLDSLAHLPVMDNVPHIASLRALTPEQLNQKFAADFAPANIMKHLDPLMKNFGPMATGPDGKVNVDQVLRLAAEHVATTGIIIKGLEKSSTGQAVLFEGVDLKNAAQLADRIGFLAGNPRSMELVTKAQAAAQAEMHTGQMPSTPDAQANQLMADYVNSMLQVATGSPGSIRAGQLPPGLAEQRPLVEFLEQFAAGNTHFQHYTPEEQRMILASALMEGHELTAGQATKILSDVTPKQIIKGIGWIAQAPTPQFYRDMKAVDGAGGHVCSGPDCHHCGKKKKDKHEATVTTTEHAASHTGFTARIPQAGIKPDAVAASKAATHEGTGIVH